MLNQHLNKLSKLALKPHILLVILVVNSALCYFIYSNQYKQVSTYVTEIFTWYTDPWIQTKLYLTSQCSCRRHDKIKVEHTKNNIKILKYSKSFKSSNYQFYVLNRAVFDVDSIKCDLHSVFRRGSGQKVLGYSLYGNISNYYRDLKFLSQMVHRYYPDWIMRIHYDDSINKSVICELECLKDDKNRYYDNTDFCYIKSIPKGHNKVVLNAYYLHAMIWRWLPLGDPFVDMFMSRDLDSWINDREYESVKVWLNSEALFHIMRDHPQHSVPMLGGMWGYAVKRDQNLAKTLYTLITDKNIANHFKNDTLNPKGRDQDFLGAYFWPFANKSSVIHDSYYCDRLGGTGFPIKRPNIYCFASCNYCCDENIYNKTWEYICPEVCRPPEHKDWIYC